MIELSRGRHGRLRVLPRWPARRVLIDPAALAALLNAQTRLNPDITLILTRGFEPGVSRLGGLRTLSRAIGIRLFSTIYPRRSNEIADIFGSNGHDIDGTHIDISIAVGGKRLHFLPLSVFTPPYWQARRARRHHEILKIVQQALIDAGFTLHRNPTESRQIHCDYRSAA